MAGIIASNYRHINRNTLLGSVDLTVTQWKMVFKGCLHHTKGGREWVNFAAKEYTDREGQKKYMDIVSFTDDAVRNRFQGSALDAIHELLDKER